MRPPLTFIPTVIRVDAGSFTERAEYRVVRPSGTTDFLIILTTDGAGYFRAVDGTRIQLGVGSAVLVAPGAPHDYGIDPVHSTWSLAYGHFHPRPDWQVLLDWPQPAAGVGTLQLGPEVAARVAGRLDRAGYFGRSRQPRAELFGLNALEAALLWCDTQNPRARQLDERILRTRLSTTGVDQRPE